MRRHNQRGQSLVEGTLVILVFLALILGVVDFGQLIFSHQALVERVRAAVRWGTLHGEGGVEPVRNMVLFGTPEPGSQPYLNLRPENVVVSFTPAQEDVEMLQVEIVNFEAPLFAPWWPGMAHRLMNPRPVSLTAPVTRAAAAVEQ